MGLRRRTGWLSIGSQRRVGLALWLAGAPVLVAAGMLSLNNGHAAPTVAALVANAMVLLSTGLVALWRRPDNATGWLLMAGGYAVLLPSMAVNSKIPWLAMIGFVLSGSNQVILGYVLLAYPWGSIANRFDRWAIVAIAVLFVTLGVVLVLTTDPRSSGTCLACPDNPFDFVASSSTTRTINVLISACAIACGGVVLIRVLRRWFVASRPARRTLTPVLFGGVVAIVTFGLTYVAIAVNPQVGFPVAALALSVGEDLIPIGLLVGFLRLRLARSAIGELAIDLATRPGARERLQDVLANRLDDSSLVVAFWSPDTNSYVDRDGATVNVEEGNPGRAVIRLERQGERQAAIVHDAALGEDSALVEQMSAVVRLAVESLAHELPAGTVTFLYTDIEGSTELVRRLGDRYGPALVEHRRLLRGSVAKWHGSVIDSRGDDFFAAFPAASDALQAAIDVQGKLAGHKWGDGASLKVRSGIHTGNPKILDGGYVGIDVHRAARIGSAAHGGQVLLSETARAALGSAPLDRVTIRPLGEFHLKGLAEPESLFQVVAPGLPLEFPPLRAEERSGAR